MLLKFATKQNINSKNPALWLCKGDFVEVTKAALRLIEEKAKSDNYKYVDSL